MYHHYVQEMAASLEEAGLVQDAQAAENVLSQCWANKVAVVWTTEDVHSIQKDFDPETEKSSLSDEQAQEILLLVFDNHDCNNGISWESLRYWSQELLEQANRDMDDCDPSWKN